MINENFNYHNFEKYPEKRVEGFTAAAGWEEICHTILECCKDKTVITAEFYPEVNRDEIIKGLSGLDAVMFDAEECTVLDSEYQEQIRDFLTDDRVFGVMNTLSLEQVYDPVKIERMQKAIAECKEKRILVFGVGASLVVEGDILLYFDMPRWEIQCRFRQGMPNWKTEQTEDDRLKKFKQGFFIEWRMADRLKKRLFERMDFVLDTVIPEEPKMVPGRGFREGLCRFAKEPFRLVPYYAPEVWGGQWMKEVCGLDPSESNYAWSFDGVPEENSIFMRFGAVRMEFPSIDVVFYRPKELLGERVHARFGDEFPIRFDFLDTMGGQNLSLQVHPLTEYIQNTFGMHYTQDESYYILDCGEDAVVYLGLKEKTESTRMLSDLRKAQDGEAVFDAGQYINTWRAKKHDHFLIPAGTVHCSGKNTMVLEISATPYIFTFKLWDWGRLGLDGKPRPVHIDHGEKVIEWDRTTKWVEENLINHLEPVFEEAGYREERTGLHEREFIETRRLFLSGAHEFECQGGVSMCNVVEGAGAMITSAENHFEPFEVHYAETFILPAAIGAFQIKPLEKDCVILRATVR